MDVPRVQRAVRVDQEALAVADADGVRTLTLSRPEARNTLTGAMVDALHDEAMRAARDDSVRAVVLTGSGTAFCAGADLGRFEGAVEQSAFRLESHRLTELVGLLEYAHRAYELGLQSDVVPDGELAAAAVRLVSDALHRAPQSYGLTKRVLLLAASADLTSAMAAETIAQSLLVDTDDHQEGVLAAPERRPPEFRGR
jgi:enoyl-CoA hydratase/carnithine racemase